MRNIVNDEKEQFASDLKPVVEAFSHQVATGMTSGLTGSVEFTVKLQDGRIHYKQIQCKVESKRNPLHEFANERAQAEKERKQHK